jgi:hypothetical protein
LVTAAPSADQVNLAFPKARMGPRGSLDTPAAAREPGRAPSGGWERRRAEGGERRGPEHEHRSSARDLRAAGFPMTE